MLDFIILAVILKCSNNKLNLSVQHWVFRIYKSLRGKKKKRKISVFAIIKPFIMLNCCETPSLKLMFHLGKWLAVKG